MEKVDDKSFQYYLHLKKSLGCWFKDYNLANILAPNLIYFAYKMHHGAEVAKRAQSIKFIRSRITRVPNLATVANYFGRSTVLFTLPYVRKDYQELIAAVTDELDDYELWEYQELKLDFDDFSFNVRKAEARSVLNVKNIFSSISIFFKRKVKLSFWERVYFFSAMVYYKNLLVEMDRILAPVVKTRKYVAFNSCWKNDNVLNEFFKRLKVPTYVLQHGAKGVYQNYIPVDVLDYENINANFYLAWGESTVSVLKKFKTDGTEMLIAGNPKFKNVEIPPVKTSFQHGLVLLARSTMHEGNLSILKILRNVKRLYGISFSLKLHPNLDFAVYKNLADEREFEILPKEDLLTDALRSDRYDFTVSYSTTAYFESLINGKLSLRYNEGAYEYFEGMDDLFWDEDEFVDLMKKFKMKPEKEIKHQIEEVLRLSFNMAAVNYRKLLQDADI